MRICDLHIHSVFSDGTDTPTQLLEKALAQGLSALALCDHNTVDGLPEFLLAAEGKDIEAIAGAEFSVEYNGKELHLLGLYLQPRYFGQITRMMEDGMARKRESNLALIRALNEAGYAIDYDTIRNSTPNGNFNRAHVAAELTRKGYTASRDEAFETLLDPKHGFYQEPKRLHLWEMLEYLRGIGAVPVLAHPFLKLSEAEMEILLPVAKEKGLAGMECCYSLYDEKITRISFDLADRFGLLYSGGSDYHGQNKPDIHLGTGKGDLQIPYSWVKPLKTVAVGHSF